MFFFFHNLELKGSNKLCMTKKPELSLIKSIHLLFCNNPAFSKTSPVVTSEGNLPGRIKLCIRQ